MSVDVGVISSFVEGAPPGEVCPLSRSIPPIHLPVSLIEQKLTSPSSQMLLQVFTPLQIRSSHDLTVVSIDIKALTISTPGVVAKLGPAFEKYNEEQFATVKLPGSSQQV
jgi:hypothetical protein